MSTLTPEKAEEYLQWAAERNPGLWVAHSRAVAGAARTIAEHCGLDEDRAFSLGLVHDIGRYPGATSLKHVYDGYALMKQDGHDQAADICLTHSFPLRIFEAYAGHDDCSDEERSLLVEKLAETEFDDYVHLVQLCDSLALPAGVCLMEKRLFDVATRHGINAYSLDTWNRLAEIRDEFCRRIGGSLYNLFPGAAAITFRV